MEWQNEPNCVWKTDEIIICDICGKRTDRAIEISHPENIEFLKKSCFMGKKNCTFNSYNLFFAEYPEIDFVYSRMIEFNAPLVRKTEKREPIGLAKRFSVMKRDGFQCVFCGNSGKDARLEIDHIIPVSSGGGCEMKNLQTLCFDCNRGKRDSQ